jgi:hypothetical protein
MGADVGWDERGVVDGGTYGVGFSGAKNVLLGGGCVDEEVAGCKGVINPIGFEFWGVRLVGLELNVEIGCDGICERAVVAGFFFPRTRLSNSRVVSSIGPNSEVSSSGEAWARELGALGVGDWSF